jgi:hypothetical protein
MNALKGIKNSNSVADSLAKIITVWNCEWYESEVFRLNFKNKLFIKANDELYI